MQLNLIFNKVNFQTIYRHAFKTIIADRGTWKMKRKNKEFYCNPIALLFLRLISCCAMTNIKLNK